MADKDESELRSQARNVFWKVTWGSFQRLMEEAPSVWNGPSTTSEARYYRSEKDMINKHIEPIYWGMFVGTFLFATFRVSGSKWFARIRDSNRLPVGRSQPPPPPPMNNYQQTQQQQWKTYLEKETEKKKEWIDESIQLPVDLLIAVLCAGSSVVWLSQPKQIRKDFAEAPLQPGRSLIHKVMCPDVVRAYDNQANANPQVFRIEDETLATFEIFAKNCRIRSEFERTRELAGDKKPGVVPYPGLRGKSLEI
jgi:hypothetical protein